MRRSVIVKLFLVVILLVMVLSACQTAVPATPTADTLQTVVAQTLSVLMPSDTPAPPATATNASTATKAASATPAPTATATITPTPTPVVYGPTNFPSNVNPLTGLVVADPNLLARRPEMIKVANFPRNGRPHAGLSAADIVFDYYIGEGANRFLALFYGQDTTAVGPMRSGRYVDAELVPMYQGILGFISAWLPEYNAIVDALGARAFTGTENTCPAICDDGRHTVTSMFANTADLQTAAQKRNVEVDPRPKLDGMLFNSTVPQGGKPGQKVLVQFYAKNLSDWHYDPASGKYLAWIENVDNTPEENLAGMIPMVDRNNNQQLAFSNVVVMFATYNQSHPAVHEINIARSFSLNKAILYRDGVAIDATWKSVGLYEPIQFFDTNKQPLALKPGNTWIFIMGQASSIQQGNPGEWNIKFELP